MTFKGFILKLNWRQILIHFIAAWFFTYSFQTFAYLHNIKLIDLIRETRSDNVNSVLNKNGLTADVLVDSSLWPAIGGTIGLLFAFAISLIISIIRKWFWVNSCIVLILFYTLSWVRALDWKYLKQILLLPGEISNNTTWEFIINGSILLTLGVLAFFLPVLNRFITNNKNLSQ